MPDDFTPEEKKMLEESPADSATMIGGGRPDDQEQETVDAEEDQD